MRIHILRLQPGQDLKNELQRFVEQNTIQAGFVLTCAGSLKQATLRLADENEVKTWHEKFEITSLAGTLSQDGMHIHIGVADKKGSVLGGHLKEGCIIHTTAEVVLGESEEYKLSRELDEKTGFEELKILKRD